MHFEIFGECNLAPPPDGTEGLVFLFYGQGKQGIRVVKTYSSEVICSTEIFENTSPAGMLSCKASLLF